MGISLARILSVVMAAFILHSIWNLLYVFRTPSCTSTENCYDYYLNAKPIMDLFVFSSDHTGTNSAKLLLHVPKLDYFQSLERTIELELESSVRQNGSMLLHIVFLPSQSTKYKRHQTLEVLLSTPDTAYVSYPLTQYAVPTESAFNLIHEQKSSKSKSNAPVSHLRTRLGVLICTDKLQLDRHGVPLELSNKIRLNSKSLILPIIYANIMQLRLQHLVEIHKSLKSANVTFLVNPVSFGKLRFYANVEQSLQQFYKLGFTDKDVDEVKGVFADTNVYFLCLTIAIGGIHLLLDFLSFKNDIHFWREKTSMAGLSSRTLVWRAFSQVIIFLYLIDEGTSLIVIIPSGIATLIEFWKLKKVFKASINWSKLRLVTKQDTAEESQTREYDDECMKYLNYILYPSCIAAAIYSLLYQPHKSWYSWTISSAVNAVYAFGFLFMLPQLFINYRLKSVAALPWRAFTYRAFNTFIDDIFAFIITMPTAHRIACFRDDLVFLVYLYQRWLYPVDKNRTDGDGENSLILQNKKIK